jgi:hypothetical protein
MSSNPTTRPSGIRILFKLFRWILANGTTQQAATPLNHGHDALSLTGEGQPAYGSDMGRLEIDNSGRR